MSNRFNNKRQIYILSALLIILLVTVVIKIPRQKSTIREYLVSFDSSEVVKIAVTPRASAGNPFDFSKDNGNWMLKQGNITAKPAKNALKNIFSEILELKPQSLIATDKSQWKEYDLTDSLANRLQFYNKKDKPIADLMIGRISFRQVRNSNMQGGNNVEGTSYVRLSNDSRIYAVEGFLALSFSGKFDDWRDRSFIRSKKEDILKIVFTCPGDSSFTLTNNGQRWTIGEQVADSVKVSDYLNKISYLDGEEFADGFKPISNPEYTIMVEGNNLLNFNVKCYPDQPSGTFYLNSSLNPDLYFMSKPDGIFGQIVKSKKYFLDK